MFFCVFWTRFNIEVAAKSIDTVRAGGGLNTGCSKCYQNIQIMFEYPKLTNDIVIHPMFRRAAFSVV